MTSIKVYNVGHGEAMIIKLESENHIIRDFGRSRYALPTETSININSILNCCTEPPFLKRDTDAILSHAHEDHFSGFKQMHEEGCRRILRNTYIPWLDYRTVNSLGGQMLKLSIYLYTYYGLQHHYGRQANHWILMAPIMLELSEQLLGVTMGHTINWEPYGCILWPPKPDNDFFENETNKIKKLNVEIEDQLRNIMNLEEFNERIFIPIFNILSKIYLQNSDGYSLYYNNENNEVTEVTNLINLTEEYTQLFRQININRNAFLIHKRSIDDHSIAFELKDFENTHIALFLSDMNKSCINRMIVLNDLRNIKYNFLKSAHHGSRFGNRLIINNLTTEKTLHCCGPAHPNWHGPNAAYIGISDEVICTDWNNLWGQNLNYHLFDRCCENYVI